MRFAYEDLSWSQFEGLVILICQRLFGLGVQPFCEGRDGGRDARFCGTAELHPSKASPWTGTTVIQAKHTNGHNRSFSEADFFCVSNAASIIRKEIPRVQDLRKDGECDNYILFSNRRLSAIAEAEIRKYVAEQCAIPESSVHLCGLEQIDLWLKLFPDIVELAGLDPFDGPLIVDPTDLADIVEAFGRMRSQFTDVFDLPPEVRVTFESKNEINHMTVEYAEHQRKSYLKDTEQIRAFLSAPENEELMRLYESTTADFQSKIIAKRKQHQAFDHVMEHLYDLLIARDPVLRKRGNKRLTRLMLFYMYWNCDIGETLHAETLEARPS